MSKHHLRTACKILCIESKGQRRQLAERIKVYNSQKRKRIGQNEDPGEIIPDCRLQMTDWGTCRVRKDSWYTGMQLLFQVVLSIFGRVRKET